MGSSAKKKREKKQDFQKTKLKVGKARPKNTNATDTSFSAKSIVLKQQSLSETGRDPAALLDHQLSLLGSRNDTQRRDALVFLTNAATAKGDELARPISTILSKAQPLVLDGNASVRQQLLKLFKSLSPEQLGAPDQALLYARAGMSHLSSEIRTTSLDVLDWLIATNGEAVVSCAGGWVRTLETFQSVLSWRNPTATSTASKWTDKKSTSTTSSSDKLFVHQLTTLARFLALGLQRPPLDTASGELRRAAQFPLWQADSHTLGRKSNIYSHLNLFGAPREVETEVYDDAEQRAEIFQELQLAAAFAMGVKEAKGVGGEVGRAAALVDKALRLVDEDG